MKNSPSSRITPPPLLLGTCISVVLLRHALLLFIILYCQHQLLVLLLLAIDLFFRILATLLYIRYLQIYCDMRSQSWGFDRLDRVPRRIPLKAEPPRLDSFIPQSFKVRRVWEQYPQASLLGLPQEVRTQIWDNVLEAIELDRTIGWHCKAVTPYDAIPLVCRQLYYETEDYLHRSIVPRNRLIKFLKQPYSESKLLTFKSLSIEIPFNMDYDFFLRMAEALNTLAPVLENLQLFFTGRDAYSTRVYLHGCGNRLPNAISRDHKLPQDGQGFQERHILVNILQLLTNLKTLVLSNLNLPILQQHILKDKPKLKKLYILYDPRSTLYVPWKARNCGTGHLLPVSNNFPPLKELVLSANSVVGSHQVVGKVSHTLEKLTWVVPNVARQSGGLALNWYDETGILLMNLRSNSNNIHTLRICMEGSIYEGHEVYGSFIGAFKMHMPHITSLKNFELHLWSKSPWIVQEFIRALPRSLQRFYTSDRFASRREVVRRIKEIYFPDAAIDDMLTIGLSKECGPTCADVIAELTREDCIYLDNHSLGFVTYEFNGNSNGRWRMVEAQDENGCDEILHHSIHEDDVTRSLLWLNGRLLDRERHKHITRLITAGAIYRAGHIPPRIYPSYGETKAPAAKWPEELLDLVSQAHIPQQDEGNCKPSASGSAIPDDIIHRSRMTLIGINAEYHFKETLYDYYFGGEDEAEKVFHAERAAKASDLPPRKYPIVVPCPDGYEDHEHWMCD